MIVACLTQVVLALQVAAELPDGKVLRLQRNALIDNPKKQEDKNSVKDVLDAELARQALLLTAREEFGLSTRDGSFYEAVERGGEKTYEAWLDFWYRGDCRLRVLRGGEEVLVVPLEVKYDYVRTYQQLTAALEAATREQLVELLQREGYKRQPNTVVDSAPLPEGAESALSEMNHISQWRALRAIHAAIRESGESPERLGGLVRGYANLTQLYTPLLDLRASACRARALLYAERLVQRWPDRHASKWHRAYAYVLVGMIQSGYEDLLAIEKAESTDEEPPAWVPLLADYHKYSFDALREEFEDTDSPVRGLAGNLWFRAVQQANCDSLTVQAGRVLLSSDPSSLWVVDVLFEESGVGLNHWITTVAPQYHGYQIAHWLPLVEELPEEVVEALDEADGAPDIFASAKIASALIDAGSDDAREPSFAVLGRGIEAWNALYVDRRGHFVKYRLGMSAEDEIDTVDSAIAGYPLAPIIRTLALPPGSKAEDYADVLGDFSFVDGSFRSLYPILKHLPNKTKLQNMTVGKAKNLLWRARAEVESDLHRMMTVYYRNDDKVQLYYNERLSEISRESPLLVTTNVRLRWDALKHKLKKLHEKYPDYPSLTLVLAQGYLERGDQEQAIEFYEKYLYQVPDANATKELAGIYFQQDDHEKWLATMERIFDYDDYGLQRSYAASAIAATLMYQGKYAEALPWAKRGSQSGASAPMALYCECLTIFGNYPGAEKLAKYNTERYGMNYGHDDWYDWCARTGQGDLEAAWKLKQKRLAEHVRKDKRDHEFAPSFHLLVTGQKEEARDILAERFAKKFSPWDGITLALLYDELGQTEERDKILKAMVEYQEEHQEEETTPKPLYHARLAGIFQEAIASGEFDQSRVDALVEDYRERGYGDLTCRFGIMIGHFMKNRGRKTEAIEYWKPSARYSYDCWERTLAWKYLRDAGVDPIRLEGRYFSHQFWKKEKPQEQENEKEDAATEKDAPSDSEQPKKIAPIWRPIRAKNAPDRGGPVCISRRALAPVQSVAQQSQRFKS